MHDRRNFLKVFSLSSAGALLLYYSFNLFVKSSISPKVVKVDLIFSSQSPIFRSYSANTKAETIHELSQLLIQDNIYFEYREFIDSQFRNGNILDITYTYVDASCTKAQYTFSSSQALDQFNHSSITQRVTSVFRRSLVHTAYQKFET